MSLITAALLFFLAAAAGGIFLARMHMTPATAPGWLIVAHPLLAAVGLILLGSGYVRYGGPNLAAWALVVLVLAAIGGMVMASMRVKRGRAPSALILLHATLAVIGILLVLTEVVANDPGAPPEF
ncbi:MAG: hypothetical protein WD226_13905 [Planctomycetota bacterium]